MTRMLLTKIQKGMFMNRDVITDEIEDYDRAEVIELNEQTRMAELVSQNLMIQMI